MYGTHCPICWQRSHLHRVGILKKNNHNFDTAELVLEVGTTFVTHPPPPEILENAKNEK